MFWLLLAKFNDLQAVAVHETIFKDIRKQSGSKYDHSSPLLQKKSRKFCSESVKYVKKLSSHQVGFQLLKCCCCCYTDVTKKRGRREADPDLSLKPSSVEEEHPPSLCTSEVVDIMV